MEFGTNIPSISMVIGKEPRPLLYLLLVLLCWSSSAFPQGASIHNPFRDRQIVFPGEWNQAKKNWTSSCSLENGEAFMQKLFKCYPLLQQGPCGDGELVLLNLQTRDGWCGRNPCEVAECGTPACPNTLVKIVLLTGEVTCDCDAGNIFWPAHERCYRAHTQGPCEPGQVIATLSSGGAICRPSSCPEGHVLIGGECHLQGTTGPCKDSALVGIDLRTLEPECLDLQPNVLISSPSRPGSSRSTCPLGSRRNHINLCSNIFRPRPVPRPARPVCSPGFESIFNRCFRRVGK